MAPFQIAHFLTIRGIRRENGPVIGLLITGSCVLRLKPMTVNGCGKWEEQRGGKSFRTSQSRNYQLSDGAIRQINEGHVQTFQTLLELRFDVVAFVRRDQKSVTPIVSVSLLCWCSRGHREMAGPDGQASDASGSSTC